MAHEIKVGQHGEECECPHCHNRPYAQWKEADQTKCETLHKKKGGRIMAHEKEKAQYEEDCNNHERPWELWEFRNPVDYTWTQLPPNPAWVYSYDYRRIEPPFQPQYFSGLNWREALKKGLVGREVEYSQDGENWRGPERLTEIDKRDVSCHYFFKHRRYVYIRTTPETFKHPTITIGDKELPRPEVEAPKKGTEYWVHLITGGLEVDHWSGCQFEFDILAQGRVHLAESRAQEWADWWKVTVVKAVQGGVF